VRRLKLQIAIVDIFLIVTHVLRARLQRTCRDATETLQLNERSVTEGHCTVMPPVSRGTTGPATDRSGGERGNWAREDKPLMCQSKHSSDVCLPLPKVPATSGQHFTIARCASAITIFSMYNVMVVSQSLASNTKVLTQTSFLYAMYVITFNVVGLPEAHSLHSFGQFRSAAV